MTVTVPTYMTKIVAAALAHGIAPGTVQIVNILHDDWCTRPDGGPCTCDPDIQIATREDGER